MRSGPGEPLRRGDRRGVPDRVRPRVRVRSPRVGAAGAVVLPLVPLHHLQRPRLPAVGRARGSRRSTAGSSPSPTCSPSSTGSDIAVAHVVGLSMGGYAVLQFALRHPDRVSAVVAAGAGSGSGPAERDQWPTVAGAIADAVPHPRHGGDGRRDRPRRRRASSCCARARASWEEFMDHLREHSALGMANTMARYQALRPSLYDFEEQFRGARRRPCCWPSATRTRPCLETNLMLKRAIPGAGAVDPPAHRPRHQPRGAGGVQRDGRSRSSPTSSAGPER